MLRDLRLERNSSHLTSVKCIRTVDEINLFCKLKLWLFYYKLLPYQSKLFVTLKIYFSDMVYLLKHDSKPLETRLNKSRCISPHTRHWNQNGWPTVRTGQSHWYVRTTLSHLVSLLPTCCHLQTRSPTFPYQCSLPSNPNKYSHFVSTHYRNSKYLSFSESRMKRYLKFVYWVRIPTC